MEKPIGQKIGAENSKKTNTRRELELVRRRERERGE